MTVNVRNNLPDAQRSLNDAFKDINVESREMLVVMMQAISANTKPYIPVDTSALINSEYRIVEEGSKGPIATIGYGQVGASLGRGTPVQEYAVYVHDGPQKNWQKPGASNRYLEKGVADFLAEDFGSIIARYTS